MPTCKCAAVLGLILSVEAQDASVTCVKCLQRSCAFRCSAGHCQAPPAFPTLYVARHLTAVALLGTL